ncbi:MAG: iron-sulfur cluster assembly scaffold protein, partial [Cyclobacteriaceae bacterium]|nr:iron-sulfur cluster assembly scaffold protein [Cyclobacteriaceae bacterium]
SIVEAEKISEENIIGHLGGVPETKLDCVWLARMSFQETLKLFKETRLNS